MKYNKLTNAILVIILIIASIFGYMLYLEKSNTADLERKYVDAQEKYTVTQKTLTGYTAFKSYSSLLTKSLSEQMKFIGAKTKRQYAHFEAIEKKKMLITNHAALELVYTVEYVIGYDLSGANFKLDSSDKGITIQLKKPEMVALPSVTESKINILSGGMFIDEKQEAIDLLNKLPQISNANNRLTEILKDEAVIALCEKKLKEFIRNVLISQHNAEVIPEVTITYF
jgi:hypothetical protein